MRLFIVNVSVLLVLGFSCITSELVDNFSTCKEFFLNGQPPVIKGILENSVSMDNNHYKLICQKYRGTRRFATLYNTTNRIPVFSAYKYTGGGNFKRPRIPWMVEPQLEPAGDEMTVPYANQATKEDFFNNNYEVNRGHLFPCCHAADKLTAKSTFTMTNIVPQKISFNAGSWNRMEIETKDIMNEHCNDNNNKVVAHVLTGAIPGKNKLNERVNIPSYMWMAFCCYNSRGGSWVSQAYWALNKEEKEEEKKYISKKSLEELQEFLSPNSGENVQLFENNCAKKHTTI